MPRGLQLLDASRRGATAEPTQQRPDATVEDSTPTVQSGAEAHRTQYGRAGSSTATGTKQALEVRALHREVVDGAKFLLQGLKPPEQNPGRFRGEHVPEQVQQIA